VAVVVPDDIPLQVLHECARLEQLGAEAGQQLLEDLEAAGEQAVRMAALRNSLAVHRLQRHLVAVDDRHVGERLTENAGGQ
jgi:hypothetical protein